MLGEAFREQPLRRPADRGHPLRRRPSPPAESWTASSTTEIAEGTEETHRRTGARARGADPVATRPMRRAHGRGASPPPAAPLHSRILRDAFKRDSAARMTPPRTGRYEITTSPRTAAAAAPGSDQPLATRYERITFEPDCVDGRRTPAAPNCLAPGHPLLDTVLDATIETTNSARSRGTSCSTKPTQATEPRLVVAMTAEIVDGTGRGKQTLRVRRAHPRWATLRRPARPHI